jgi:hypothetical protein
MMRVDEHIPVWERPSSYAGHNPEGDYVVISQHRDSDALVRSNYTRIYTDVLAKAVELGQPAGIDIDPDLPNDRQWVYSFRASHWAVGWIEYVILRNAAPDDLVTYVGEIRAKLDDYPVYDEDHFSELEHTETQEYWSAMDLKERIAAIRDSKSDLSIFAARRDSLGDIDDNGSLYDWLRS